MDEECATVPIYGGGEATHYTVEVVQALMTTHGLNVSTKSLKTLFWTSRLGLVSRPSLQCIGLVTPTSRSQDSDVSVSASCVSFTTLGFNIRTTHYSSRHRWSSQKISEMTPNTEPSQRITWLILTKLNSSTAKNITKTLITTQEYH